MIEVFNRYEEKYIMNSEQFKAFLHKADIYAKPDEHCTNGDMYSVTNIYFDNDNYDLVRMSNQKPYYKQKVRLRGYSGIKPEDFVYLEVKKKVGGLVNKRRTCITLREAADYIDLGRIPRRISNMQVFNELDYLFSLYDLKPKMMLCYDRIAYNSKGGHDIRITVDNNIRFKKSGINMCDTAGLIKLTDDDTWIVEIKTGDSIPLWCTRILSEMDVISSSFSKYGNAYEYCVKNRIENEGEKIICLRKYSEAQPKKQLHLFSQY
ncbi:MAG: polyphosphate polymerase domain-containing protein [Clostridia bacterium]